MSWKYVILKNQVGQVIQEQPFIFPETIVHSDMALMLSEMVTLYGWKNLGVASAGFLDFELDCVKVHGESESLGVKSRGQEDIDIIESYSFMHGLSDLPPEFRAQMMEKIRTEWRKQQAEKKA